MQWSELSLHFPEQSVARQRTRQTDFYGMYTCQSIGSADLRSGRGGGGARGPPGWDPKSGWGAVESG
jgi:hypothetical protein